MRNRFWGCRPGDFLVFLMVLIMAAAAAIPFLFVPSGTLYLEVRCDNQLVKRVKLSESIHETFTVQASNGGHNTVQIDGMRVRIAEASCHDQVCVRTGWLTRAGQAAVCLPNRVVVKLVGQSDEDNGVDAIVR